VADTFDEMQQRIDRLEADIADAQEQAEEVVPEWEDDEPRYVDSGSIHPELDDQTITPPG
jgi:hypothetical protein